MATITEEAFIFALGLAFIYLIVYRKNKIVGDIFFFLTGLAMLSYSFEDALNYNLVTGLTGIIITLGSIADFIYDMIPTKTKRRNR